MPQSLVRLSVHVIFSTKHRRKAITPEIREELIRYVGGLLVDLACPPIEINCVDDHLHILSGLSKTLALAEVVEKVKARSSKWIKTKGPQLAGFYWQGGYAAFSVSESMVAAVREYIRDQPEHHRRRSFEEELREFLRLHRIEFDERYLWD